MKFFPLISACVVLLISGCSFNDDACEDVNEIARQASQCQALQREINSLRGNGNVIARSELERRYEKDCIELRFYRDEKQPAICENKAAIEEEIKTEKEKIATKKQKNDKK